MAGVKIAAAQNGGSAEIAGPPDSSANTVLKLPGDTGSAGQVLKVKSANHSATNAELEWAADAGGKIVDVKQAFKTDFFTSTSTSYVDITGLSLTHTLADSSNKLLLTFHVVMGAAWWNASVVQIQLIDDSTAIAVPTGSSLDSGLKSTSMACNYANNAGNSSVNVSLITSSYLYTPGDTSSHTYKLQGKATSGSGYSWRVNGLEAYDTYGATSSLTLMEVAG